jgi:hypothetical protein
MDLVGLKGVAVYNFSEKDKVVRCLALDAFFFIFRVVLFFCCRMFDYYVFLIKYSFVCYSAGICLLPLF